MLAKVTTWTDFAHISEEFDSETDEFQYTMFAIVDPDDVIYYCELPTRKSEISIGHVVSALQPVADSEIYPEWPSSHRLSKAALPIQLDNNQVYIKRPNLPKYDVFKHHKVVHLLAQVLLEEAYTMEFLHQRPHPNIVRYRGCCHKRGYLTGIVLDRYSNNLEKYLKKGNVLTDTKKFMDALESAICHLHSLGWAHNDLNPTNVMIDESEVGSVLPILIDFGSSRQVDRPLGLSRGTTGWVEGKIEDYTTSAKENDIFALKIIRTWLDNPTFEEENGE